MNRLRDDGSKTSLFDVVFVVVATLLPAGLTYGAMEWSSVREVVAAIIALGTIALGIWLGLLWYKWLVPAREQASGKRKKLAFVSAIVFGIGVFTLARSCFSHRMVRAIDATHFENDDDDRFSANGDD